jgi:23S rRNA (guanosine2251-2'-O)-methyltransferase
MRYIVHILLPDIRSAYNVGSIFRSADCFGVEKIFLSSTTPRPTDRFGRSGSGPQKEIAKTALGAEKVIAWEYVEKAVDVIKKAKKEGFIIVAVEQSEKSINFATCKKILKTENIQKILCIVGNEVEGVSGDILKLCDHVLEIPMKGKKESLNVSVCAGVVMYELLK